MCRVFYPKNKVLWNMAITKVRYKAITRILYIVYCRVDCPEYASF